jgi:hypothetical protein
MQYSESLEAVVMIAASFLVTVARTRNVRRDNWRGRSLFFILSIVIGVAVGFYIEPV